MKTKNILSISLIFSFLLMMACTPQPYFDVPLDSNGNVIITGISDVPEIVVTTADANFTLTGYFPNAKSGDAMEATVLKHQVPSWDPTGELQLLPLENTVKSLTVGGDLKASVTYTLAEAQLVNVGDAITVVFSGATDAGIREVILE